QGYPPIPLLMKTFLITFAAVIVAFAAVRVWDTATAPEPVDPTIQRMNQAADEAEDAVNKLRLQQGLEPFPAYTPTPQSGSR
ncbi:MAG: hypothetical protein VKJ24_15420, partial [Synechococcales bacterium]|nr:hypothetical protein [Synechococcales bacterium]